MARKRRYLPPLEVEITGLGPKGLGRAETEHGEILVRGAAPGSRVLVTPFKKKKGTWHARKTATIRPAPNGAKPRCAQFGLCGGCTLQELSESGQRVAKGSHAIDEFALGAGVPVEGVHAAIKVHSPRSTGQAYGYRNKVELTFGVSRFLSESDHAEGQAIDGRFLGFHAPGRFDRVVDAPRCELISEALNGVLAVVRAAVLVDDLPPNYNPRTHEGFWRHLILREGITTGEILVGLVVASHPEEQQHIARIAAALEPHMETVGGPVVGLVVLKNDGVADVARGDVLALFGRPYFYDALNGVRFKLSLSSFFQTNTTGASLLYDTIGEALGEARRQLFDLYCGAGSIGLYLADRFDQIVGVELVEAAVLDARANAQRNGVKNARYVAADMSQALEIIEDKGGARAIVVDPPRVGLHPKVAAALATATADVLVYVACKPRSLGRDASILAQEGWVMTDLWPVDMFPQTGHVELVARFVRP